VELIIDSVSQDLVLVNESRYRKSKFHEAVTKQMVGREGKHIFGRMHTGEGKSFVMIMIANAHVKM
jgi:hypothetical protein